MTTASWAPRGFAWLRANPPLLAFLIVYLATCYLGAVALLFGPSWVRDWYVRLSGAAIPPLDFADVSAAAALLHLGPALLICGWALSGRVLAGVTAVRQPPRSVRWPRTRWLAVAYAGLALYLLFRLVSVGAPKGIEGWANYDSFIDGRGLVVERLSFAEFVLVYSVLPLVGGGLVASILRAGRPRRTTGLCVAAVLGSMAVIHLLLFQKRSLLIALFVVVLVVALGRRVTAVPARSVALSRRALQGLAGGIGVAYVIYIVLLVTPVVSSPDTDAVPGSAATYSDDFARGAGSWQTAGSFLIDGAQVRVGPGRTGQGLHVSVDKRLRGAAVVTGVTAEPGSEWSLTFALRAPSGRARPEVLVGERLVDVALDRFRIDETWSAHTLTWSPQRRVENIEISVRLKRPGTFELDDVRLVSEASTAGKAPGLRPNATAAILAPPLATRFPRLEDLSARPRPETLFFYALLGPFTRTSGPAIAYAALYPEKHPYYPVDLGLDAAGIGVAPDDNRTSFELMFPDVEAGTNSVPYMFTLYSQGGLLVAFVGSVVLGFIWGALWRLSGRLPVGFEVACLRALLVVGGVFVAGDSWRNAVLTSYGLLWPALLVLALLAVRSIRRMPRWLPFRS